MHDVEERLCACACVRGGGGGKGKTGDTIVGVFLGLMGGVGGGSCGWGRG